MSLRRVRGGPRPSVSDASMSRVVESQSQRRLRESCPRLPKATKLPRRGHAAAALLPCRRALPAASQRLPAASQTLPRPRKAARAQPRCSGGGPSTSSRPGPAPSTSWSPRPPRPASSAECCRRPEIPAWPAAPHAAGRAAADAGCRRGPAPACVHEGAALSDDDEDDGSRRPGGAGRRFCYGPRPVADGHAPLLLLRFTRLPAKDALALRATSRAFRERITLLSLAPRPPLGVVGRKCTPSRRPPRHGRPEGAIKGRSGGPAGNRALCRAALRALLKLDSKKGAGTACDARPACAANSATMLDVALWTRAMSPLTNDFEAARSGRGARQRERARRTRRADVALPHAAFAAAACRVCRGARIEMMVRDPHVCSLRGTATLFALGVSRNAPDRRSATIDDPVTATASHVLDSESRSPQPSVLSSMAVAPFSFAFHQAAWPAGRRFARRRTSTRCSTSSARAVRHVQAPGTPASRRTRDQPLDSPWGRR